jgi:hypothetical protein
VKLNNRELFMCVFANITPLDQKRFYESGSETAFLHGSLYDPTDGYIYLSPRGMLMENSFHNRFVKILASDYAQCGLMQIISSVVNPPAIFGGFDEIVGLGENLYSNAMSGGVYPPQDWPFNWFFQIPKSSFVIGQSIQIDVGNALDGNPLVPSFYFNADPTVFAPPFFKESDAMACDGNFLYLPDYVYSYNQFRLYVVDVTGSKGIAGRTDIWNLIIPQADFTGINGVVHSMVVDSENLYISLGSGLAGASSNGSLLIKVSLIGETRGTIIGIAHIAQATDDMTQDSMYCFIGCESQQVNDRGASWGAAAIRKSDMAIFALPRLNATDCPFSADGFPIVSYASCIFGNYHFEGKTNGQIYVIDQSHPDHWLTPNIDGTLPTSNDFYESQQALLDDQVMGDFRCKYQNGNYADYPNELMVDGDGYMHVTFWENPASICKYLIPDFSLVSAPTVQTAAATEITSSFATLNGFILATGNQIITDCGFYYGTDPDALNTQVHANVVQNTNAVNFLLENLNPTTTYYFKFYAVNSQGEDIGDVMSFTTLIYVAVPVILGTVVKDSIPVQGVTVFLVNVKSGQYIKKKTTNINGRFSFTGLSMINKYHVALEYIDENDHKWNAKSNPYIIPILK